MTPRHYLPLLLLLTLAALGLFWPGAVFAQGASPESDRALAERYLPILYFHPAEIFRPQPVDVLVDTARLRAVEGDLNLLLSVTIADLLNYPEPSYALDAWYGDPAASDYKNYTAHRAYYQAALAPDAGGPPPTTYARVVRDPAGGRTTIQYWFFYYYNDWFNKHEGDWELAQVVLDPAGQPEWLALGQHHAGTRRPWTHIQVEDETHPAVFVSLGSHAAYFTGDETYPHVQDIGTLRIEAVDRTGRAARTIPELVMLPESGDVAAVPGFEWMAFGGHWGEAGFLPDLGGPLGPSHKGDKWGRPIDWAFDLPLDQDVWYRNRLRVEVSVLSGDQAFITLHAPDGALLNFAEQSANPAILHLDPTETLVHADIELPAGQPFSLTAVWPDGENGLVTEYRFDDLPPAPEGRAALALSAAAPVLTIPGLGEFAPDSAETRPATWDAPDVIWIGGLLPASEVVRGLTLSLLAAVLPSLLYVSALYWADRYEKEPKRLIAAAFVWGALPALLVALVVRVFFQLPPELLGPNAMEALRLGLFSPLVEEALKGAAVLFIAHRYRREFDNVLDGMLYAAVAGFGFAMTGNLVSYVGAFLLRGFAGLSTGLFVQGLLFALDHALFTALFGAGLGYARLHPAERRRFTVPVLAFAAAVLANALHSLALAYSLRPAIPATLFALAGLVLAVGLFSASLRRQWWLMARHLIDEVPPESYRALVHPRRRVLLLFAALRRGLRPYLRHRRRMQLAAELAFKKDQLARFPAESGLLAEIDSLRLALGEVL